MKNLEAIIAKLQKVVPQQDDTTVDEKQVLKEKLSKVSLTGASGTNYSTEAYPEESICCRWSKS
jgi:hypothetical protein